MQSPLPSPSEPSESQSPARLRLPNHPGPPARSPAGVVERPSAPPAAPPAAPLAGPLASPAELRLRHPVPAGLRARIDASRRAVADVLHGRDPRLLVVVGPCSLHDADGAREYARRLAPLAARHEDALVCVMRAYVEKPRSGPGWKGLLNDPDLDGSCDVARGVEVSRALLLSLAELGVACASELLDPLAARYLEDLLAWAAIGARTAESQVHRELASRCAMPVGVKNGMAGEVDAAVLGALAAREPHASLEVGDCGRVGTVRSRGNPDTHVVLRGGRGGSNHGPAEVARAAALAAPLGLARPLLVDCSHGNSGKDHRRQAAVCREVLAQVRDGQPAIAGLLLEGHLREGRQAWEPGQAAEPDRSITDACMGWEETADLLEEAADVARASR